VESGDDSIFAARVDVNGSKACYCVLSDNGIMAKTRL